MGGWSSGVQYQVHVSSVHQDPVNASRKEGMEGGTEKRCHRPPSPPCTVGGRESCVNNLIGIVDTPKKYALHNVHNTQTKNKQSHIEKIAVLITLKMKNIAGHLTRVTERVTRTILIVTRTIRDSYYGDKQYSHRSHLARDGCAIDLT